MLKGNMYVQFKENLSTNMTDFERFLFPRIKHVLGVRISVRFAVPVPVLGAVTATVAIEIDYYFKEQSLKCKIDPVIGSCKNTRVNSARLKLCSQSFNKFHTC